MNNKITKDQEIINLKNAILGYQSGVSLLRETLEKIKSWLEDEVNQYEKYTFDDNNDVDDLDVYLSKGRHECAESLYNQIKKWETDDADENKILVGNSIDTETTEGFNLQEVETILDSLDFRLKLGQNKGKDQTRELYKYFESMKIHLEGEKR